jgi:hypothetical protein
VLEFPEDRDRSHQEQDDEQSAQDLDGDVHGEMPEAQIRLSIDHAEGASQGVTNLRALRGAVG